MKQIKSANLLKIFIYLNFLLSGIGAHATGATTCLNVKGGTWNFGTAPQGCNVSVMQSPAFVKSQYSPVLFNEAISAATARNQYLSEMYPVAREVGSYYIHRRNSKVSAAESEGFAQALFALAAQESYWTHYRQGSDGITRFMRGDSLHGYGIMQLDDRSHAADIKAGKGTDLIENMVGGLDVFYTQWVRSASASCVSSASNYRDRARAAWAAYNGGGGSICRWTNTHSAWAANDRSFYNNFTTRHWLSYVANTAAPSKLDVKCLAEGTRPCAAPQAIKLAAKSFSLSIVASQPAVALNDAGSVSGAKRVAVLQANLPYRLLRECAGSECSYNGAAVRGAELESRCADRDCRKQGESFLIVDQAPAGWLKVQSLATSQSGWIKSSEVLELEN